MRKLLLLLIPIFLLSCGKDEENNAPDSLVGTKWGYAFPITKYTTLDKQVYQAYHFLEFINDTQVYVAHKAIDRIDYNARFLYSYSNPHLAIFGYGSDTAFAILSENTLSIYELNNFISWEISMMQEQPLSLIKGEPKEPIIIEE